MDFASFDAGGKGYLDADDVDRLLGQLGFEDYDDEYVEDLLAEYGQRDETGEEGTEAIEPGDFEALVSHLEAPDSPGEEEEQEEQQEEQQQEEEQQEDAPPEGAGEEELAQYAEPEKQGGSAEGVEEEQGWDAEQDDYSQNYVWVQCPQDKGPGDTMQVQLDDGTEVEAYIPDNVEPGGNFDAYIGPAEWEGGGEEVVQEEPTAEPTAEPKPKQKPKKKTKKRGGSFACCVSKPRNSEAPSSGGGEVEEGEVAPLAGADEGEAAEALHGGEAAAEPAGPLPVEGAPEDEDAEAQPPPPMAGDYSDAFERLDAGGKGYLDLDDIGALMEELNYDRYDPNYEQGLLKEYSRQYEVGVGPEDFSELWEKMGGPDSPGGEGGEVDELQPELDEGVPLPQAVVQEEQEEEEEEPEHETAAEASPVTTAAARPSPPEKEEEADEDEFARVAVPVGTAGGERLVLALSDGREVEAEVSRFIGQSIDAPCALRRVHGARIGVCADGLRQYRCGGRGGSFVHLLLTIAARLACIRW
jgi:Ca2+-binding EF-hand superfamily protein